MKKLTSTLKKKIEKYLIAFGNGDKAAFEEVYRLTFDFQYLQAYLFLNDADAAEDIVQDTFLHLYRSPESIKNVRYPYAYVKQITNNLCLDYVTKASNAREQRAEDLFFEMA
ncbi:MAG: sigma factor, partial [Eubacterium sp.]